MPLLIALLHLLHTTRSLWGRVFSCPGIGLRRGATFAGAFALALAFVLVLVVVLVFAFAFAYAFAYPSSAIAASAVALGCAAFADSGRPLAGQLQRATAQTKPDAIQTESLTVS